jgi:hypothetical protein
MDAARQQAISACGNCGQPEDAHKFRGGVGRDDLTLFAALGGPCTSFTASDASVIYARHLALAAGDPARKPGKVGKRGRLCTRCLKRGHQAKDCPL